MRYIFDFDDVLFFTSKRRKEHTYPKLEQAGISLADIDNYYEKERMNNFSIRKLISHFSLSEDFYEEIMREIKSFNNTELIEIIKKLEKHNCYIVTAGDEEFQLDKIKRAGINQLFSEIVVTSESKKEAVEIICARHSDEQVIFIDDTARNFEDLDFKKCPNLKVILYDERGLEKLKAET